MHSKTQTFIMPTVYGHRGNVCIGDGVFKSWEIGYDALKSFELQSSMFKLSKTFNLSEILCLSKMINLITTFCLSKMF